MSQTIYWHDYETFGANPSVDRPSQFAGIRTDLNLDIIGDPLMIYCQPIADMLPSPDACLITGITPQHAQKEGIPEPEFIARIHAEFSQPQTCGAGYNSIRFDDEVTRYSLYRNFYDPYAREWQNGNSRWDIIDMVRLTYALRPETMVWPEREPGVPSFKLELLSEANGLEHEAAHDALSDVIATIKLAQHIKNKQPKLYEYCWNLRNKSQVASKIDLNSKKPLLHISSKIPASRGCATIVMPLAVHPSNKNAIICVDLCADSAPLFDLDKEALRDRLYSPSEQLAEGELRVPLKAIHTNRCPVILPLSMLDNESAQRLQIDLAEAEKRWQKLLAQPDIQAKAQHAFNSQFESSGDADSALYEGFIPNADRTLADSIRKASAKELKEQNFFFEDTRLTELLYRYKARHYPDSLSDKDHGLWLEQIQERFLSKRTDMDNLSELDLYESDLLNRLAQNIPENQRKILSELQKWAQDFRQSFSKD